MKKIDKALLKFGSRIKKELKKEIKSRTKELTNHQGGKLKKSQKKEIKYNLKARVLETLKEVSPLWDTFPNWPPKRIEKQFKADTVHYTIKFLLSKEEMEDLKAGKFIISQDPEPHKDKFVILMVQPTETADEAICRVADEHYPRIASSPELTEEQKLAHEDAFAFWLYTQRMNSTWKHEVEPNLLKAYYSGIFIKYWDTEFSDLGRVKLWHDFLAWANANNNEVLANKGGCYHDMILAGNSAFWPLYQKAKEATEITNEVIEETDEAGDKPVKEGPWEGNLGLG